MSVNVGDVAVAAEKLWPTSGAEEWDNVGLLVGRTSQSVSRVLLVVDAVVDTVDEAIAGKYDAIIAHHPLILRGVQTLAEDTYKGALIGELIRNNIALFAMHTNADVVPDGVSDVIAARLGLVNAAPIVRTGDSETGLGRVGDLTAPTTLGELAQAIAQILPATAQGVQVAGDYAQPVSRVALCGGAGDSLLDEASVRTSDVYVTSDLRHHRASESREQSRIAGGPALINVSHWASEWLWLAQAAAQLREALPGVTVDVSDLRTDPWDFVVTQ
jgi:dinuclear metal center YbgI/SA1388 family protein